MSGGGAVPSIIVLKRLHFKTVCAKRPDRLRRGIARRGGGVIGDVGAKRRGADRLRILQRLPPLGGVEDQLHIAVLDSIDDMRAAFGDLVDALDLDPLPREIIGGRSEERRGGRACVSTCRSRWLTHT